jgi:stage II sporulation protein AB (anti-sigma F factor)
MGAGDCRYVDPPSLVRRFVARADQVARARHEVVAYAREHGALDLDAIAIAVTEAVTNVVLHAYVEARNVGEFEVTVQRHADDGLEVHVCDEGRGMMPRSDSPGVGLGLPLVAKLAERLEIQARPGGGTALCMVFAARGQSSRAH